MKENQKQKTSPTIGAMICVADFAALLAIILLARKSINLILAIVLPNGRKASLIAPLVIMIFLAIILEEYLEFSFRKFSPGKYLLSALCLWGVVATLATGYGPYEKALKKISTEHIQAGGGVYKFTPNISFKQLLPPPNNYMSIDYFFDRDGNRSCPYSKTARPSIILVGDSFIYGLHLVESDTLCAALGDALKKQNSKSFSIRNLGVAGLGFHSYMKIIEREAQTTYVDTVIIGYLSRNDFAPYDTFFELSHLQKSRLYQLLSIILGPDSMSNILNWLNNRIVNRQPRYNWYAPYIEPLKKLSNEKKVVIVSYWGNDSFIDYIEKNIGNIEVVQYDLRQNPANEKKGLIIPFDGHPTRKANQMLAKILAKKISAPESK